METVLKLHATCHAFYVMYFMSIAVTSRIVLLFQCHIGTTMKNNIICNYVYICKNTHNFILIIIQMIMSCIIVRQLTFSLCNNHSNKCFVYIYTNKSIIPACMFWCWWCYMFILVISWNKCSFSCLPNSAFQLGLQVEHLYWNHLFLWILHKWFLVMWTFNLYSFIYS